LGAKAHFDGIVAFSQIDFTEDLKTIGVPVLVMHGGDDHAARARLVSATPASSTRRALPSNLAASRGQKLDADEGANLNAD
jgi:pimeloyl-ACP methyl ester carboxylesterase